MGFRSLRHVPFHSTKAYWYLHFSCISHYHKYHLTVSISLWHAQLFESKAYLRQTHPCLTRPGVAYSYPSDGYPCDTLILIKRVPLWQANPCGTYSSALSPSTSFLPADDGRISGKLQILPGKLQQARASSRDGRTRRESRWRPILRSQWTHPRVYLTREGKHLCPQRKRKKIWMEYIMTHVDQQCEGIIHKEKPIFSCYQSYQYQMLCKMNWKAHGTTEEKCQCLVMMQ